MKKTIELLTLYIYFERTHFELYIIKFKELISKIRRKKKGENRQERLQKDY